jgi:hypothetical protein
VKRLPASASPRPRHPPRIFLDVWLFGLVVAGCLAPRPTIDEPIASSSASSDPARTAPAASPPDAASTSPTATAIESARDLTVTADDDQGGHPMVLTITDPDHFISTARAATSAEIVSAAERARMPTTRITVEGLPRSGEVLVVWAGFGCDRWGDVAISGRTGQIVVAPEPIETCDLVPSYRGLALTFTSAVDINAVRPILMPTELTGS